MITFKATVRCALAMLMLAPLSLIASSHREAPITALDKGADVPFRVQTMLADRICNR